MQPPNSIQIDYDDGAVLAENLFKAIGLYQLLQNSSKCGRENRYRKYSIICLWLTFVAICLLPVRLYLDSNDLQLFQFELMVTGNMIIDAIKGYLVIVNADKIWDFLEAARYGFTGGRQDPSRIHRCRYLLSIWLHAYIILVIGTVILWILTPLFAREYLQLTKMDGTTGNYRASVINLWYPVTESMYNWLPIWAMIYMYEAFMFTVYMVFVLFYDLFLITMCVIFVVQFESLSAAYETLGHQNHHIRPSSLSSSKIYFIDAY